MRGKSVLRAGILGASLLVIAACAGPRETVLADGTVAYRIDCESTSGGLNYCFERAGKSCGADGYTLLGDDGSTLGSADAGDADIDSLVRTHQGDQNSILVRCGT